MKTFDRIDVTTVDLDCVYDLFELAQCSGMLMLCIGIPDVIEERL